MTDSLFDVITTTFMRRLKVFKDRTEALIVLQRERPHESKSYRTH